MASLPLVLFESFHRHEAFRRAAGLYICDADRFNDAHKIDNVRVEPYRSHGDAAIVVYMAVPRAHDGVAGFVASSCKLIAAVEAAASSTTTTRCSAVFVYHSNGNMASLLFGDRVTGVNVDVTDVMQKLGLAHERPSDATLAHTRRTLGSPMRIVFRSARTVLAEQQRPINAADGIDDYDLQAALLESERLDREVRAKASTTRIPFKREWSAIVREQSDDVAPGQPVCLTCCDKRASICFVDCGHQLMCDVCVRLLMTRADVRHECPVCRTPPTLMVRPNVCVEEDGEPCKKKPKNKPLLV